MCDFIAYTDLAFGSSGPRKATQKDIDRLLG